MTAIRLSPNLIVHAAWEIKSNLLKRDVRAISLLVERKWIDCRSFDYKYGTH